MNQEEMSRLLCGIVSHVTSMEKDYGDARKTLQELGLLMNRWCCSVSRNL